MKRYFAADKRFHVAALILLITILCMDVLAQYYLKYLHTQSQEDAVFLKVAALRYQMERDLTANLLLIQGAANFISATDNLTDDIFARYAKEALAGTSALKNLAAAPDFIMRFVYPLKDNEAILGLDYRTVPTQWPLVDKAYKTGKLVVAGPIKLLQGGTGLIGRAPVFTTINGTASFWGIVSAVIDMDLLVRRLDLSSNKDIAIAIRGKDGMGAQGDVFMGDAAQFEPQNHPVLMPITFPAGSWQIAATPRSGWVTTPPLSPVFHALFLAMAIAAIFTTRRILKSNYELKRTHNILNEAQAAAHLGNWDLDVLTGKLWWSDEVYRIFGLDKTSLPLQLRPTLRRFTRMTETLSDNPTLNPLNYAGPMCLTTE